jgi:hypothetical protein
VAAGAVTESGEARARLAGGAGGRGGAEAVVRATRCLGGGAGQREAPPAPRVDTGHD